MPKIIIAGGGLVGAMLANILAESSFEIHVIEKRHNPFVSGFQEKGRSINLALSTRGWHALQRIGLERELLSHAIPMYGRAIHHLSNEISFQPYSIDNQAIYSVSRNTLNLLLLKRLQNFSNVVVHYQKKIVSADIFTAEVHTECGDTFKADALIGADGAFSSIQQAFTKTDRFSFCRKYISHGYKELSIPPDSRGDFVWNPNALHIFPRKRFMLIALPNCNKTFTATLFLDFEGEESFEKLSDEAKVSAFFKTYFEDFVRVAPNFVSEFFENPTSSLGMVSCEPWYRGKTLLIGDAAHAIVPFYGQGMNAGFEDCLILEECLQKSPCDIFKAFQVFADSRKPDTDAIAELAMRNFIEMRDLVTDERFLAKKQIERELVKMAPDVWIPQYSLVTFSRIPYRKALEIGELQDKLLDEVLSQNLSLWQAVEQFKNLRTC